MKRISLLVLCIGVVAFPAAAYQTGPAQSNFSAGPAATKASSFTVQTRAFTNYASRHPGWSRGVNTQTVQTQAAYNPQKPAQQPAVDPAAAPGIDAAAAVSALTKGLPAATPKAAAAPAATKPANEQPAAADPKTKEGAATDPAAVMQQMAGMQDMMKNLGALSGLMQGGAAPAGQGQNATPAMPAGVPDMSKLLQGMGVGSKPK